MMIHHLNAMLFGKGAFKVNGVYAGGGGSSGGALIPITAQPWLILQDSKYWFQDNAWGAGGFTQGSYSSDGGSAYTLNVGVESPALSSTAGAGNAACRFAWGFPSGGNNNVKAYPAFIYGARPGWSSGWINPGGYSILLPDGVTASAFPSGKTPFCDLPVTIDSISAGTTVNVSFNWHHNSTPTGNYGGQVTFDIWLQNTAGQSLGFSAPPITHEIMIPVDAWGDTPNPGDYYGKYGIRNPSWYVMDTTIQGKLWHCYHAPDFNGSWVFIVFEPDVVPVTVSSLEIGAFILFAKAQGWLSCRETVVTGGVTVSVGGTATHLVDIELGVEMANGTGDLTISNFGVTIV